MKQVLALVMFGLMVFMPSMFAMAIPAIEEFVLEFLDTGGIVDITDEIDAFPGEAPGSYEFEYWGTVFDPLDASNEIEIDLSMFLDPDPEILWGITLTNYSSSRVKARSRMFTDELIPPIGDQSMVRSQIESSSSVTDGDGDGVTISPYGQDYFAVSELLDIGAIATNMGVDIGTEFTRTGSGMIPPEVVDWKLSPQDVLGEGETWHSMRTYVSYTITPRDIAHLVGRTEIQPIAPESHTPEPSTLILFGVGILGMIAFYGWRKGRRQQILEK